jgi:hypothetical protein
MALKNRDLEVGTRLAARYKGQTYTAEVVQTEEGLRYRLEDGREFKSPSSAGSAVMGGVACNGWRFWSLEGEERPSPKAQGKPKAKGRRGGRTSRNPELLSPMERDEKTPDDQDRWYCLACAEPFTVAKGHKPEMCPKGHRPAEAGGAAADAVS